MWTSKIFIINFQYIFWADAQEENKKLKIRSLKQYYALIKLFMCGS